MASEVLVPASRGARLVRRITAGAMVVVGIGNAALGALVVLGVGSLLQVPPSTGWGLLVAGPLLAALGVWLWVGGVVAARAGLAVVVALLLANAGARTDTEGAPARAVLLILLAIGCAVAARRPVSERAVAEEGAATEGDQHRGHPADEDA